MAVEKEFSLESIEHSLKRRGFIRDLLTLKKHIFHPKFSVSVEKLCSYAGLDLDKCSNLTAKTRRRKVMAVCAVQPTFQKGCICVQLYEDTEEDMRWAVRNGALAIVVKKAIDGLPCIVSDAPETIYAKMCRYYRKLSDAKAVAITGSIGKTTTKFMIDSALKKQFNTICNPTNENVMFQVGHCAQHIPMDAQILVQEISEGTPGYTSLMSEMVDPDIVVITTIDKSHMEALGSGEKIIEEVCSITKGLSPDARVVVNKDEFKWFDKLQTQHVVTVSLNDPSADLSANNITITHDGLAFDVLVKESNRKYPVLLKNIYAVHNVVSALSAFAVGLHFKTSPELIVSGLQEFKMKGVRQNVLRTADDITIYADCFNAVATSVKAAIKACDQIPVNGKRIAVLGDVEEGGKDSEMQHDMIVQSVNESQFSIFIAIGEKIQKAINRIPVGEHCKVICCNDHKEILAALKNHCSGGDLVLFKASYAYKLFLCIAKMWPSLVAEVQNAEKEEYSTWWNRIKMS